MNQGPIVAFVVGLNLLAVSRASANEPEPTSKASFPIVSESDSSSRPRESSLDRLNPSVVAALPPLPATTGWATPIAPPPSAPPPSAAPPSPEWETKTVRRRPSTRSLHEHAGRGPDAPDAASPKSSRDRDRYMLSLEGATRAPIDLGFQSTFETPVGLRLFGGFGWVPSMYLGKITGTAAAVSSDPVLGAMLESGFQSGNAWRLGAGIRPFRDVGVYLDAGYSRVSLRGAFDTSQVTGIAGLGGSYEVESSLGLGFLELGYQAKIAERVVLAGALGVTKVFSAKTHATAKDGAIDDPRIGEATTAVDEGLVTYGVLPTLTLRLGLDLI